jgi:hypothetical protein
MTNAPPAEQKSVLLLLFAPGTTGGHGEPIQGRTRLMKESFLLDQEGRSDEPLLHVGPFIPYKFGPFNVKVLTAIEDLEIMGLVQKDPGDEMTATYRLTPRGRSEAQTLWSQLPPDARKDLVVIKAGYNGLPLTRLLHYVYSKYPEYTVESELREQLLGSA